MTDRGRYHTDELRTDLLAKIASLERRIADLEAGNRITKTAIDGGNLTVQSGASIEVHRPSDDAVVARVGNLSDIDLWGLGILNPNNSTTFFSSPILVVGASDVDGFNPEGFLGIYDNKGNLSFSTSQIFGLSSPAISYSYNPSTVFGTPSQSTTSGSFAALWTIYGQTYHSGLLVDYLVQNDAGTSSEVRIRESFNSSVVSTTNVHGSGAFVFGTCFYTHIQSVAGTAPFPSMTFKCDLEARRTAGAGNVRVQAVNAVGI